VVDQAQTQSSLKSNNRRNTTQNQCQGKHADLVTELERRQDSYMRREDQLRAQLAAAASVMNQQPVAISHPDPSSWQQPQALRDGTTSLGNSGGEAAISSGVGEHCQAAEEELQAAAAPAPTTAGMAAMQQEVISGVEQLLERQLLALRADEYAQLRHTKVRLADVEAQLAAERAAREQERGEGGTSLVSVVGLAAVRMDMPRGKGQLFLPPLQGSCCLLTPDPNNQTPQSELRQDLESTRAIAEKLDAMYHLASSEAARLRIECSAQEDDRQHLIRQMLMLKRDKYQLGKQLAALQTEMDALIDSSAAVGSRVEAAAATAADVSSRRGSASRRPATAGAGVRRASIAQQQGGDSQELVLTAARPATATAASGVGLNTSSNIVEPTERLQRLLASEQRQLRALRAQVTSECARRTELQSFLVDGLEQVKRQIRQQQQQQQEALTAVELVAKEQILQLVLSKCCPELKAGAEALCSTANWTAAAQASGRSAEALSSAQLVALDRVQSAISSSSSSTTKWSASADEDTSATQQPTPVPQRELPPSTTLNASSKQQVLAPFSTAFPSRWPLGAFAKSHQGRNSSGGALPSSTQRPTTAANDQSWQSEAAARIAAAATLRRPATAAVVLQRPTSARRSRPETSAGSFRKASGGISRGGLIGSSNKPWVVDVNAMMEGFLSNSRHNR